MTDEIVRYPGEEPSIFQLTRIIQAMGQQYSVPITAYLSDVEILNDCAVGVVVGQIVPGLIEKRTGAYLRKRPANSPSELQH